MDNPVRLHWLDPRDPDQPFPPAQQAMRNPNGLLAVGGDLGPQRLVRAYSQGIFPWYNPDEPILWWSPNPRAVLYPEAFHCSRSLGRSIRRADFALSMDRAFDAVLDGCGEDRAYSRGTWLGPAMKAAYRSLFELRLCHSVELWRRGHLVGGLYGVALGRVFFGESMFSRQSDASKIALCFLCRQLAAWGFELIDCQVDSPHLQRLGAVEIPRNSFLRQLDVAQKHPAHEGRWRFDLDVPASSTHLPAP